MALDGTHCGSCACAYTIPIDLGNCNNINMNSSFYGVILINTGYGASRGSRSSVGNTPDIRNKAAFGAVAWPLNFYFSALAP